MFRRRNKRAFFLKAREALWPSIGWRRWLDYIRHRVGRMPGTPYAIAAGFAFGAAVSFTPFMGFHILLGAVCAYLARASILAAAVGTVVGNPWTFPFIWLGIYELGNLVLGTSRNGLETESLSVSFLLDNPWSVFLPMAVGGLISSVFVWVAFFFPLRRAIATYQRRRIERRNRKLRAAERGETLVPKHGRLRPVDETENSGVS